MEETGRTGADGDVEVEMGVENAEEDEDGEVDGVRASDMRLGTALTRGSSTSNPCEVSLVPGNGEEREEGEE